MSDIKRIYVEKKEGFDIEAKKLLREIREYLNIKKVENLKILNRYDIEGIDDQTFDKAKNTIFSEPPVDIVYVEDIPYLKENLKIFAVEYLPGQYDQRADSASQAIQLITHKERPIIRTAKVIILYGEISEVEFERIKSYVINPVDSRIASLKKPETLIEKVTIPEDIMTVSGFIKMKRAELMTLKTELELAMDEDDLLFCQNYFKEEKRDPTITELRVIDTYWSDHCRHTTFLTEIDSVCIENGKYERLITNAYNRYLEIRKDIYNHTNKPICLMDIATIAMKKLKKMGKLKDLDESEEINACSIIIDVNSCGKKEKWLLQFKNETHNHPTEIEPFGGAATCIGGAIRDPLSGRAYVYQAMRVTGSGDPRTPIDKTLAGKLPQRKITTEAAHGYSSYGNQIGVPTGLVSEIYHEGYVAKRMEIGAVIGAVPKSYVVRKKPVEGDVVILLGGGTGRDGCGGATGSSKAHTEESIVKAGAEVQKGNAPEERKIQRLFRKKEVIKLIKKCNDFGAGGVSVAVGELADGLTINLDLVPKKYEGLDGTELAISESQERMAVVVSKKDAQKFIEEARKENLNATIIAEIKKEPRMKMFWRGKEIVNLSRNFLNSNGAKKHTKVTYIPPDKTTSLFDIHKLLTPKDWLSIVSELNLASQKGLVEMFDSTVGGRTVLMPFGGKYQLSPIEAMVAKIPVYEGETNTVSIMSYGFNPEISSYSPFHGAMFAIVESVAKIVATGGDYKKIRLSLQEYFEKPFKDPVRWAKPFTALLGAFITQMELSIPAIGGKDSMSGTFKNLDVPPTLVSFAVTTGDIRKVVSSEFKKVGSNVYFIPAKLKEDETFDFVYLKKIFEKIYKLIYEGKVLSASSVKFYGLSETISKMCIGNKIGFKFENFKDEWLFKPQYGSFVIETDEEIIDKEIEIYKIGRTVKDSNIIINDLSIALEDIIKNNLSTLSNVFPYKTEDEDLKIEEINFKSQTIIKSKTKIAKPRVFIPVFFGTNTEYESAEAFRVAGARPVVKVFVNMTSKDIEDSIDIFVKEIENSQIIYLPGGFSAGDEPDGSGKFIAAVFRNPKIKDAVMNFLNKKDGLILGICNGFQALIKLGLVPYGEIRELTENSPTLTFNKIGRHVSQMVFTKIVSNLSPWFMKCNLEEIYTIPVSHGEGRFIATEDTLNILKKNGQIASQYVDENGKPTMNMPYNPNGSYFAIEGITSPDGRILGKMGHSERRGNFIAKNIPGNKWQPIFESGVAYFD
ncbi:MAG: phosphoribosylformylglycinamidine synthase [Brevinematales bacterium]|nr:phosphoribosylformylglycinamidine synthase [Brevinematales bacterium]